MSLRCLETFACPRPVSVTTCPTLFSPSMSVLRIASRVASASIWNFTAIRLSSSSGMAWDIGLTVLLLGYIIDQRHRGILTHEPRGARVGTEEEHGGCLDLRRDHGGLDRVEPVATAQARRPHVNERGMRGVTAPGGEGSLF